LIRHHLDIPERAHDALRYYVPLVMIKATNSLLTDQLSITRVSTWSQSTAGMLKIESAALVRRHRLQRG
jgi:hypothetical protein